MFNLLQAAGNSNLSSENSWTEPVGSSSTSKAVLSTSSPNTEEMHLQRSNTTESVSEFLNKGLSTSKESSKVHQIMQSMRTWMRSFQRFWGFVQTIWIGKKIIIGKRIRWWRRWNSTAGNTTWDNSQQYNIWHLECMWKCWK